MEQEKEVSVQTKLHAALAQQFGENRVTELLVGENQMPLLLVNLDLKTPVTLIMTNGLSDYEMPVHEKMKGYEFNELYFCLPSYWELKDAENPTMNWVFPWIQRLSKYVVEKKAWFGHGHTMPCGVEMEQLSPTMRQNHFFLSAPLLLEEELKSITIDDKTIHFLSIIPIFSDEMDYKQGKGTRKFLQKLNNNGVTEKLDDYRGSVLKRKWRLLKR